MCITLAREGKDILGNKKLGKTSCKSAKGSLQGTMFPQMGADVDRMCFLPLCTPTLH